MMLPGRGRQTRSADEGLGGWEDVTARTEHFSVVEELEPDGTSDELVACESAVRVLHREQGVDCVHQPARLDERFGATASRGAEVSEVEEDVMLEEQRTRDPAVPARL